MCPGHVQRAAGEQLYASQLQVKREQRTERDIEIARGMQQKCADHNGGEAAHLGHHLRPRLRLLRKDNRQDCCGQNQWPTFVAAQALLVREKKIMEGYRECVVTKPMQQKVSKPKTRYVRLTEFDTGSVVA